MESPATASLAAGSLRWLLATVLAGQFMAVLDATIVNVATPTIRLDLHTSGSELQLIVAGYTIAYAVLLITGARLGGIVGYRRMFLGGLAVFTAASFACGFAPNADTLIAFRFVQGAGAALMVPQIFSLIQRNFQGTARARALGLFGAIIALGAVVGQVVGGVLVTANVLGTGWRPVFLVNVPIGLVLLLAATRTLPRDLTRGGHRLDVPGLVALAGAVLLLVVPLVLGHEEGWPVWTYAALALSIVVLGIFVAIERGVAARSGAPLISTRVLRAPGMAASLTSLFLGMAAYAGFLFAFAQHLQAGLGDSAQAAGLTFGPAALGFAISSLNWRRVPTEWHRRMIVAGFGLAAVGYAATAAVLGAGGSGGPALLATLFITGLGQGAGLSPLLSVALETVAPADAPDASGLLTTVIQLGFVVGVATFGSVFLSIATPARQPGMLVTGSAISTTLELVTVAMAMCAAAAWQLVLAERRVRSRAAGMAPVVALHPDGSGDERYEIGEAAS
jgi:MFS family permease